MTGEDPWEADRLDSPQTHWKKREGKKATEAERKVSSDENEALGQNEESSKQGLSPIWQLSTLSGCLSRKCSVKSTVASLFIMSPTQHIVRYDKGHLVAITGTGSGTFPDFLFAFVH